MSEITKLYENAGLSNMWVARYNDGYYEHERYYNSYKEMILNMMKANARKSTHYSPQRNRLLYCNY